MLSALESDRCSGENQSKEGGSGVQGSEGSRVGVN